jgi:predicted ATP-grasp superfamily ATP-dependent carboligase
MCRHGVSFPESIFDPSELDRLTKDEPQPAIGWSGAEPTSFDSPWLVKSRSSSGGLGVAPLANDVRPRSFADPFVGGRYYQRRIAGLPFGAVYLASSQGTFLLGLSLQLTCRSDDGKRPFRYAGSVGPERLANLAATGLDEKLDKIGGLATSGFRLSGIFSLDFILDEMRTPWLLEINPRYTASVELIERATGDTVYAKRDIERVPESLTKQLLTLRADAARDGSWSTVADIPSVGSAIRRDEPLATVFASGATENAVLEALERREEELHALLDRLTSVP